MSNYAMQSSKLDLKPKRHHGYAVILFIMGTLFPPLAVAARFGIGKDFWLNLLLTVCGYIPGHGHNFYIQNVRNNKNNRRTPKWAQRYGLIDTSEIERKKKKSQWANRYNDRLPNSTLEGQEYEDGEIAGPGSRENSFEGGTGAPSARRTNRNGELWTENDEQYYGQNGNGSGNGNADQRSLDSSGGGRWHYPANFEDTLPPLDSASGRKKEKKGKKDRWARTEDAYAMPQEGRTRKKKKKKGRSTVGGAEDDGVGDTSSFDRRSSTTLEYPEDPVAMPYGDRDRGRDLPEAPPVGGNGRQRDELDHDF